MRGTAPGTRRPAASSRDGDVRGSRPLGLAGEVPAQLRGDEHGVAVGRHQRASGRGRPAGRARSASTGCARRGRRGSAASSAPTRSTAVRTAGIGRVDVVEQQGLRGAARRGLVEDLLARPCLADHLRRVAGLQPVEQPLPEGAGGGGQAQRDEHGPGAPRSRKRVPGDQPAEGGEHADSLPGVTDLFASAFEMGEDDAPSARAPSRGWTPARRSRSACARGPSTRSSASTTCSRRARRCAGSSRGRRAAGASR